MAEFQPSLDMASFFERLRTAEDSPEQVLAIRDYMAAIRSNAAVVFPQGVEPIWEETKIPHGLRQALLQQRMIQPGFADDPKEGIQVAWNGQQFEIRRYSQGDYYIDVLGTEHGLSIDEPGSDADFLDRVFAQDIPEQVMEALLLKGYRVPSPSWGGGEAVAATVNGKLYTLYEDNDPYAYGTLSVSDPETGVREDSDGIHEETDVLFMAALFALIDMEN